MYEVTNMLPILTDLTYLNRWRAFGRLIAGLGQLMHVHVNVSSANPLKTFDIFCTRFYTL